MKTCSTIVFGVTVSTAGPPLPAHSQDETSNRPDAITSFIASLPGSTGATNNRARYSELSAGIGFPAATQAFHGSMGPGIGAFPDYEGADNYGAAALPLVDIGKSGAFYIRGTDVNPNNGLAGAGMTLFHSTYTDAASDHSTQFLLGPFIRIHGGRDESDNKALEGLGDIDSSAGIGAFVALNSGPWAINMDIAPQDAGDNRDGLLLNLAAAYTASFTDTLKLTGVLSTSWADDDYMQGYFGITGEQAARSSLRQFDSGAGFKDIGVQFKASYTLSRHWGIDGQVGYWYLLNDAADSPLVEDEGSVHQIRSLVGLSYKFR